MRFKNFVVLISLLAAATSPVFAQKKCGGAGIANGPFSYTANGVASATYTGPGGGALKTGFTVLAPNASGTIVVFPGEGQNPCLGEADATIGVMEITQVGDSAGNPLTTEMIISPSDALYNTIASAFAVSPSANTFTPGSSVNVNVTVSDPIADGFSAYGVYLVKIASQAPGAGIGVGPGFEFTLTLLAPAVGCTNDTTPPIVAIIHPATGDEATNLGVTSMTLGNIAVEVQAYDPLSGGGCPSTGLQSLTVSVSSAGGTVSGLDIPLTLDPGLAQPAGVVVTGKGTFTPTGGSGSQGTTDVLAFTGSAWSGIGTYTLTATATDVAGNSAMATFTFPVTYFVSFTMDNGSGCGSANAKCMATYHFAANRSGTASDGAFMFDHSVDVQLYHSATLVADHSYGTGSINSYVQLNTGVPDYETKFELPAGTKGTGTYSANVYFTDVDGNPMLQAVDSNVSF